MSEKIHDKGYKRLLSKKKNFLDMLKSFVKKKWVDRIREDDIQLIDKEFIPKDFQEKEADIIYKCSIDGKTVIFYILIELQSSVDYTMPFRLLVYITELMKREFLDTPENEREKQGYRLPAVLPIVLHNGIHPWNVVQNFREYQIGNELFDNNIVDFNYLLLNVNTYDDNELFNISNLISLVFALDKKGDGERLIKTLKRALKTLTGLSDDDRIDFWDWLKDVLMEKHKGNNEDILDIVSSFEKGESDEMEYAIGRLFDEIEEKGIEKGMRIIVERMLKNGKSVEEISLDTGLTVSQIISIKESMDKLAVAN